MRMGMKYLGALVAVMLVAGACGASSEPSTPVSSDVPGVSPSGAASAPPGSTEPSAGPVMTDASVGVTIGTDTGAELTFDPAELTVPAGADVQVTFDNRASVPHNLTFQAPINVATSTVVAPGTSETVRFKAPAAGEYTFVCTLHPGMGGRLLVEAR